MSAPTNPSSSMDPDPSPGSPRLAFTPKRLVAGLVAVGILLFSGAILAGVDVRWQPRPIDVAIGFLVFVYAVMVFATDDIAVWNLVRGQDGRASTSKFQPVAWTVVVLFGYVAVIAARFGAGFKEGIPAIPENVLIVMGITIGTGLAAKAVTVNQVETGKSVKDELPEADRKLGLAPLFQSDGGEFDMYKSQTMAFTLLTIGVFLAQVVNLVNNPSEDASLPDIDNTLMVLMGFGSAAYLGRKFITQEATRINSIDPATVSIAAGTTVTLSGLNFGVSRGTGWVAIDGVILESPIAKWTDTEIQFVVPRTQPNGTNWRTIDGPNQVQVQGTSVAPSNAVSLRLTA